MCAAIFFLLQKGIAMPEIFTLLGAGATLLGSLNRGTPKTEFEAVKFIDEQDPVRKTLEAVGVGVPCDIDVFFIDGTTDSFAEIVEIGYGAFRYVDMVMRNQGACIVVRYSAVARIRVNVDTTGNMDAVSGSKAYEE